MPNGPALRARLAGAWPYAVLVLGVVTVFWKIVLTTQYTFLENPDLANQVLPWLEAQVVTLRRGGILLWTPYEWFGQSLIGQVQPGVTSPFTFLLALAPLDNGQIQISAVHLWFVFMHCAAAVFAYWLLRDLQCRKGAAVAGGVFYATAGYCGNTEWPQQLAPGVWAPLVFLFLLRSLRGQAPRKSAAWAGVALGVSWLCGHHGPSLMLTLAAAGVGVAHLLRSGPRAQSVLRLAIVFCIAALVSAVQVLPAVEYGRLAKRWTASGALTWNDKVQVNEHEDGSLKANDLPRVILPGGNGLRTDPFAGAVGLSLAFLAVWGAFRRREVRIFAVLGICALLYAMARHNPLYGPLYALLPMVEKSRAPIVALSIFHFAVAVLAGLGADLLASQPEAARESRLAHVLLWAGAGLLGIYALHAIVPSIPVEADPRPRMTGLILLLLGALYTAWSRGYLRRGPMLALLGMLLVIEQGNEVGWNWAHERDLTQGRFLKPLFETRDVGDYLRGLPDPKRVGINDDHLKFTFGDWYRLDAGHAFTASMLTRTSELNWWQDRLVRMYAVNYEVSKAPTRAGQQELFTGASGIKVFRNPDAFPRAWTVHRILTAPGEAAARDLVRDGSFDLREAAVMTGSPPPLETCAGDDRVTSITVRPAAARIRVEMACTGLLLLSDNWYPGWRVTIDGSAAPLLLVNTVLRGVVVVGAGRHEVAFDYRPWSVYLGLLATLLGVTAALVLQRMPE